MTGGTLDVDGATTLDTFTQSGGTFDSGSFTADNFDQTGGTVATTGDFTATQGFTQSAGGTVDAGGDVDNTQSTGDVTVNNVSGRNVAVTSTNGSVTLGDIEADETLEVTADSDINQTSGSTVAVGGDTTLAAGGDIDMSRSGNQFGGTVNASGDDITITDSDNDLNLGAVAAGGDLNLSTPNGGITQTDDSSVTVVGKTDLQADKDILLKNGSNDFKGQVSVAARRVELRQAIGDLLLGNVDTTEGFFACAPGTLTQKPGTRVKVGGGTTLAGGTVFLPNPGNRFTGPVRFDATKVTVESLFPFSLVPTGQSLVRTQAASNGGALIRDVFARRKVSGPTVEEEGFVSTGGVLDPPWHEEYVRILTPEFEDWLSDLTVRLLIPAQIDDTGAELYIRKRRLPTSDEVL